MKARIWVLCTVLTDENAPAMPAVFADETAARAAYDTALRAEWSRWELTSHDIEIETSAAK